MSDDSATQALRARWIFPVTSPPVANAYLTVRGDRIASISSARPDVAVQDLGNVAIIPGLVNAHTHLEFSDLSTPLGEPGVALPRWIGQVIAHRRAGQQSTSEAVRRGLAECLAAGTTTVGEIATGDWRTSLVPSLPRPDVVMFREAIAATRDRVATVLAEVESFFAVDSNSNHVRPAISPHAPYTVHPELLAALVELSVRFSVPLAMHLAESPEELELLATRGGEFRTLLKNVNAWDPRIGARFPSIGEYLELLSRAPRALVIHGNYLSADELNFLAQHSGTMSVVYCPRTHDFFRHAAYPLADMLAHGLTMALGTDSRASNPDLNLWEEMRFVAERHPRVSASEILALGTRSGARALGLEGHVGAIEPGKVANLAVIQIASEQSVDPHDLLFASGTRVTQTWLRGQPIFGRALV